MKFNFALHVILEFIMIYEKCINICALDMKHFNVPYCSLTELASIIANEMTV